MTEEPRFFRIGCFVLLGAALLIAGLLIFGGGQIFRQKVFAETYVDGSVQGIEVGSPVKFRGVQIGRVKQIDFTFNLYDLQEKSQAHNYVAIIMEIDRPIAPGFFEDDVHPALEKNINEGLRVRIEPQGITGLNYLDFGYVNPVRYPPLVFDWKPWNFYVPYAPGEITSFLDSINNIMREVEDFNIEKFTKSGTELLENMNKAVLDAQLGKVSDDLRALIARLDTTITDAHVQDVSADIQKLIKGLESNNSRLEKILANLEPSTRLNSAQIQEIIANAAAISENLLNLSNEVKSRPSLLLWGAPKPTPEKSPAAPKRRPSSSKR